VAGAGLGGGMALIALGKYHTLFEPLEAAREILPIFAEEIRGELVDRHDDEQAGRRDGRRSDGRRLREGGNGRQSEGASQKAGEAARHEILLGKRRGYA